MKKYGGEEKWKTLLGGGEYKKGVEYKKGWGGDRGGVEKNIHKKYFQILSITKNHKNSQKITKNHKSEPFWAAVIVL